MPVLVQLADSVIANKFPLSDKTLSLGRSADNDVQIDDRAVSGHHAWIEPVKDEQDEERVRYRLVDLNSTNGSFLNEKKVSEEWLRHNDMIRIGWVTFKFIDETQQTFEETTKVHKSWIPGIYYTK
jgi:pSer/pThr/pTyr-binding forkhead associated (FHA) protein